MQIQQILLSHPRHTHAHRLYKFWDSTSSDPFPLPKKKKTTTKKRAANINQNRNLNKILQKVPLSHCIPVNYVYFPVCFGTRKKIQICLLIVQTQGICKSLKTNLLSSATKLFKQFVSPWHPVTSKQEGNISSQENWFVALVFTSYNTSKVLYSIFQDLPWLFFRSRSTSEKCFGKASLVQSGNFLVWKKTYLYIYSLCLSVGPTGNGWRRDRT